MPTQLLVERIPLPSLQKYVFFSCVALASAVFFAWTHAEDHMMEVLNSTKNISDMEKELLFNMLTYMEYYQCFTAALLSHIWTVWVSSLSLLIQINGFGP